MKEKLNKKSIIVAIIAIVIGILTGLGFYETNKDKSVNEIIDNTMNEVTNHISTYEMTDEEVKQLPSTEIIEQTERQENEQEQEVESEAFELQGEIAYEGDKARNWNIELGDYKGLTYYSQIDSRWSNKMYSSVEDKSQTIGTSGCGPTSASMIVTACKGTITPDMMSDLFVKYGYRSANNGTYWSAFRAVADEFNIGYEETSDIQRALQLLQNKRYVVASVGNGLFTTGGHFIVLIGIDENTISIYDPYLYSGKFETSTRRGKVSVNGNTVYCSVDNFIKYANAKGFFCYAHDNNIQVNNTQPVTTSNYTRYVNTKSLNLNVRNTPNGRIVGSLRKNTQVKVDGTNGAWSHIITPINGWVSSNYLASYIYTSTPATKTISGYRTGNYKVNASVLNVRYGAGTKYKAKTYKQLTSNARNQNKRLGNYYTNGYKHGVVCTVTKVNGNWGLTASGWICLDYCSKT